MEPTYLLLLLTALFALPTWTGTCAIFPDGSRLVRSEQKSLYVYNPEAKTETERHWPAERAFSYPAIAATKNRLLVGGGTEISSYDPATNTWASFWKSPDGMTVDDIAFDAKNRRTVVVTSDKEGNTAWWVFAEKSAVPGKLFNRRATDAENPV